MEHRRPPELFCGFRRRRGRGPTLYPSACSPQAWASGAPFLLLQAMLGLTFDYASNRIELVNPSVPQSIGSITIRNLALGSATADFVVRQGEEAISLQVLRASPGLRVSIVFNDSSDGIC
jgi:glycogen debranching enzyme